MKKIIATVLMTAALAAAVISCGNSGDSATDRLNMAESAFDSKRFKAAQSMADSLLLATDLQEMSVAELCRLSVLFMKLSDNGTEQDVNTAYAARALAVAYERDPDSTEMVIAESPVDDKAVMSLLSAINEASHGVIVDGDTIYITSEHDEEI